MRIYDFEGKKNISGERIREARLKLRLSQSDLAARVQVEGVTMERDSISRIEIGTRFIPDYEIPVFARVLGVSALWLLISARVPKELAAAFKEKCAAEGIPQAQIIKKAIEEFLSQ